MPVEQKPLHFSFTKQLITFLTSHRGGNYIEVFKGKSQHTKKKKGVPVYATTLTSKIPEQYFFLFLLKMEAGT